MTIVPISTRGLCPTVSMQTSVGVRGRIACGGALVMLGLLVF